MCPKLTQQSSFIDTFALNKSYKVDERFTSIAMNVVQTEFFKRSTHFVCSKSCMKIEDMFILFSCTKSGKLFARMIIGLLKISIQNREYAFG